MDSQTLVIRSHLQWLRADRRTLEESISATAVCEDTERLEKIRAEMRMMDEMIRRYQRILQGKMLESSG